MKSIMSKRTWVKISALLMVLCMAFPLCACRISTKKELVKYAKDHYGACTVLDEEHGGSGNDEYRVVYLKDKDTQIEYKVASGMYDFNIDGSSFGYVNNISSNFENEYSKYLLSDAEKEISSLEKEYGCSIKWGTETILMYFKDRVDVDEAYEAAQKCDKIMSVRDVKNMRPVEYVMYAESTVYLGFYNASSSYGKPSNTYKVIDFVHKNYDPDAVFLDSLGCYLEEFLSAQEIASLLPDKEAAVAGTAYYFKDKNSNTFVAIDMEEMGVKGGKIRLFRVKSSGMEEIDF